MHGRSVQQTSNAFHLIQTMENELHLLFDNFKYLFHWRTGSNREICLKIVESHGHHLSLLRFGQFGAALAAWAASLLEISTTNRLWPHRYTPHMPLFAILYGFYNARIQSFAPFCHSISIWLLWTNLHISPFLPFMP